MNNAFRRRRERKIETPLEQTKRTPDWVGRAIAIGALMISGASFYFGNLRVVDDFHFRLVGWDKSQPSDTSRYNDLLLSLALVNDGNRLATITGVGAIIDPRGGDIRTVSSERGIEAVYIDTSKVHSTDQLPLTIAPNSIRLVEFSVPGSTFEDRLGTPRNDAPTQKVELKLIVHSVDSRGTYRFSGAIVGELKFRGSSYETETMYSGPFQIFE